jgi:Arc/MetJ-type ribon-helix-helix transcriptional regulator
MPSSTSNRPSVDSEPEKSYRWDMTLQLSPEQENRVAEALCSGAYGNPCEVIDRALEVLHEQDEWLTTNRLTINAAIHQGIEELDRGEGISEEELDIHLARLKAEPE